MHWAVAIPFMVCYATALILVVVYNPDPTRPYRQVVSWVHRISGLCLLVLPATALARHWRDLRLHRPERPAGLDAGAGPTCGGSS